MAKSTYANFTVQSQTSIANSNRTNTEYENQSFFIKPRTVETLNLKIPFSSEKQKISLTYDNNTVVYYIQTYKPVNFPFGNNPLGLLAFVGIIMLMFTAINIGISKAIINKAKYFPKMSQRIWIAMIIMTGIIIYNIVTQYYYDLTGYDWGIYLIPLFIFDLLLILNSWQGKDQEELLIHIHETSGKDIETGIYAIHTAQMSVKELAKYPIEFPSGKEFIDPTSYKDFLGRLINRRIPINMDMAENPDNIEKLHSGKITKKGKKMWKLKDRINKEHPFSEGYFIDPLGEKPAIVKKELPTGEKAKKLFRKNDLPEGENSETQPKEKYKKAWVFETRLNGHHMREAEKFLSDYIAVSESGKKIHELSGELAKNTAELNTKAYNWQSEIVKYIFDISNKSSEFQNINPEAPKENKEKIDKKEGEENGKSAQ